VVRGAALPRPRTSVLHASDGLCAGSCLGNINTGDAFQALQTRVSTGVLNVSQARVRELLAQLHQELETTSEVDEETLALARKLDQDIDQLIEIAESKNSPEMENAIALEAQFAARHPMAARITRELIETLGRMGI